MHKGVGMLLAELMRIKAEGDYAAIKALVDQYGVHFDPALRDQVVARYNRLNVPTYWCGINADLTAKFDPAGKVTAVAISLSARFREAAVELRGDVRSTIARQWLHGSIRRPRCGRRKLSICGGCPRASWNPCSPKRPPRGTTSWSGTSTSRPTWCGASSICTPSTAARSSKTDEVVGLPLLRPGGEQGPDRRSLPAPRLPHRGAREPDARLGAAHRSLGNPLASAHRIAAHDAAFLAGPPGPALPLPELVRAQLHADRPERRRVSGRHACAGRCTSRRWSDHYQDAAASLISAAYSGHVDSRINDQYRSTAGARRFLYNIVQYPGCGTFYRPASYAAFEAATRPALRHLAREHRGAGLRPHRRRSA